MFPLFSLAGRTEDVLALVHVELLQLVASGTQVLAGVELGGLLGQHLTNGCRHGQTTVRVDGDLIPPLGG